MASAGTWLASHGHSLPAGNPAAGCHSLWQALGHAGKSWPRPPHWQPGCRLPFTVTSSQDSCDGPVYDPHFSLAVEPLSFYQNVSPPNELCDASNEASALLRDYIVGASLPVDVFNAKVAAENVINVSGKSLTPEEQRLVDKMILEGKRDGLALPEDEREGLQKALSQTCLEFSVCLVLTLSS